MKPIIAIAVSALIFGIVGRFIGLVVGFPGLLSFLVLGAAGALFGLLITAFGAKAFWLPACGIALGFALVLVAQLLSPTSFDASYYMFAPLLTVALTTPLGSALALMFPAARARLSRSVKPGGRDAS